MAEESTQHYLRSINVNEKLLASIDNGIIILNNDLCIMYYNNWLELHTSIKEKDILGIQIGEVFPNINLKTLQRKIKTALRMGTPTFYTATISKYLIPIKINQINVSDFAHMRQDVSVIPFDQEKGLVAIIITDQTNMTNTHNLLQSNIQTIQELNNQLIKERETIDERVILLKIDTNFIIKEISHAYRELLDYETEEVVGKNFFEFDNYDLEDSLQANIRAHIESQQVFKYEKITLSNKENKVWLSNTIVPEYDQKAHHIGFIIFSEDISDAKLVQEHQIKLLENSRTAAMGEMISMIAHQWRQPLSVINTVVATLKIKKELNLLTDDVANTSYKKIETTVKYLSETIDDFRNFFKKNKELTQTTIQHVFEKSNQLLKAEMDMHEINYIENIKENLTIKTHENELIQTIINILKNSIDAFKENNLPKQTLTVTAYSEPTGVIIEIEDNAGGIKKEILSKVFEPYFSTKSKNGTGLGLYVCKTIIEEHLKGRIQMQSINNTTKTIIELPEILIQNKE